MEAKHDRERIVALRRASLERAGYDPETARALAERVEIPLQDALALRKAGFPPEVALAMLDAGDRPVF
ncbi:MAG: hypothetical protein R6W48_06775 [Gaiellaceae bacterium]